MKNESADTERELSRNINTAFMKMTLELIEQIIRKCCRDADLIREVWECYRLTALKIVK